MFRGVSALTVDSKGRLAIPTRHREALVRQCEGQLVVTVNHNEHCLWMYPLPEWEEIQRKLVALPSLDEHAQILKRILMGHATDCELDGAGRVLLTPPLRKFASIEKQVVLLGQGNKFEIWDETHWNTRRDEWLAKPGGTAPLSPELESLSL